MYTSTIELIKTQVAEKLNIAYRQVKTVQEWAHVYFITFWNRKALFVSKKSIKVTSEKIETTNPQITEINYCKVKANSQIRNNGRQRGLLLKDLQTGEQYWLNNNRLDLCDPLRGAKVKVTHYDNQWYNFKVI